MSRVMGQHVVAAAGLDRWFLLRARRGWRTLLVSMAFAVLPWGLTACDNSGPSLPKPPPATDASARPVLPKPTEARLTEADVRRYIAFLSASQRVRQQVFGAGVADPGSALARQHLDQYQAEIAKLRASHGFTDADAPGSAYQTITAILAGIHPSDTRFMSRQQRLVKQREAAQGATHLSQEDRVGLIASIDALIKDAASGTDGVLDPANPDNIALVERLLPDLRAAQRPLPPLR